jgi:tetratricopeptide (TPR) repeat protein
MKMRTCFLATTAVCMAVMFIFSDCAGRRTQRMAYANSQVTHSDSHKESEGEADQAQPLKAFNQKGTKVFVQCDCWQENRFREVFLTEMDYKGIWRITSSASEADFILKIQAIPRPLPHPSMNLIVYDMYALLFDKDECLLWRSDLHFGHKLPPPITIWDDLMKAGSKEFIKTALLDELPESRNMCGETLDILGKNKVPDKEYDESEGWYWQGMDYFVEYNHKKAVKMFSEALKLNPHNAFAYKFRALAYARLSKYNNARDDILVTMKLDPLCTQNDTIYANIVGEEFNKFMKRYNKAVKGLQTMYMIAGIAGAVTQSMTAIASINNPGAVNPSAGVTSTTGSTGLKREVCSSCNGTGKNLSRERPAFYNYSEEDYSSTTCSICGSSTNHYHRDCFSCQGKGYRMK